MTLGVERLLQDKNLRKPLLGQRLALLAHPASVDRNLHHSLDLLRSCTDLNLVSAFGPQHGMRGEKQDNMIESDDYVDPKHKIPVFSLYGEVRRPTPKMMDSFDVVLVDLQDVGCRIYTFITTLFYMMDACQQQGKELWVLDRPNPAGRPVEGNLLKEGFESFVGAAPIPMRHGLTLGEAGLWYKDFKGYDFPYKVIEMTDYDLNQSPGWGWPVQDLSWVNPSPNMPRLSCARQYAGTVLLEGTLLSEGRGTTTPLEMFGAPGIDADVVLKEMHDFAPQWLKGCRLRTCFYEPTFHKFKGELCSGLQIHVDGPFYDHQAFRPYRVVSSFLKAVHKVHPEMNIWRQPPYEYEEKLLPIEILSGGHDLISWVEDSKASADDWDEFLSPDEKFWEEQMKPYLLY